VAYAFVQDIASSWEQYELVTAPLLDPAPVGLILHLAGRTEEGFRIIDIWQDVEAFELFQAERVQPAIAAIGGPNRPEPAIRDLQSAHLVLGSLAPSNDERTPA
jgi:hypothetical protein